MSDSDHIELVPLVQRLRELRQDLMAVAPEFGSAHARSDAEDLAAALGNAANVLQWALPDSGVYKPGHDTVRQRLPIIQSLANALSGKSVADVEQHREVATALDTQVIDILDAILPSLHAGSDREQLETLFQTVRRRRLAQVVRTAELGLHRVQEVAEDAEEAAGVVGSSNLATHFETIANSDRRAAEVLRVLAVVALAGTALAMALLVDPERLSGAGDYLRHYGALVPAAVIAAYFARESNSHRASARWADGLATQLRTLRAFTDTLPQDLRNDIRATFGRRLFLEANPSATPGKSASMGELDAVLQRLIELGLGRSAGGSMQASPGLAPKG